MFLGRFTLELGDRVGHQLHIEVESYGGDVTCLCLPEDGSGTPNLQVSHCQLESRAEIRVLPDGFEPSIRRLGQRLFLGMEQICVGTLIGATDAAP